MGTGDTLRPAQLADCLEALDVVDEVPPAPAPGWLLVWVQKPRDGLKLRVQAVLADAPGVVEGRRHDAATRLIGAALARGEEPEVVKVRALAWAERCTLPLPAAEVLQVVDYLADSEASRSVDVTSDWAPPIPFPRFELSPFPVDALPGWLGEYVMATAEATQTPPELPGLLGLSVLATCAQRKAEVEVDHDYREPLNLYTAVALPPATRKSAVFGMMTEPLTVFERGAAERLLPEIAEAKARRKLLEGRLAQLHKKAAGSESAEEAEELAREAGRLTLEVETFEPPIPPRLLVADSTPEQLEVLLAENGERLALLSPEGEVFDLIAGRYGNGKGGNYNIYLKAHAGDGHRVDRIGRDSVYLQRPALTLGLAIQPEVLRGLSRNPSLRGRGLLGRFLYALPPSLVGRRRITPAPVPRDVRESYHRSVISLLSLTFGKGPGGEPVPRMLHLSPAAYDRYLALAEWIEPRLAEGAELGHLADWAGKLAGAVLRISGLLHVADHAGGVMPWDEPISDAVMEQAVRIGHCLIPHAQAAFAEMGADPSDDDARHLLAWLTRHGKATFTLRDLFEGVKGRFKRTDLLQPALGVLTAHQFLRKLPDPPHVGPGRPRSPAYALNPAVWAASCGRLVLPKLDHAKPATAATDVEDDTMISGIVDRDDDDELVSVVAASSEAGFEEGEL